MGLTQDAVADRLNISVKSYQRLENGETKIDLDRLKIIADILEVSVTDLINADDGLYIHKVTDNTQVGFSSQAINFHNNNEVGENERKLFREMLEAKDKEIAFLKSLIEDLKK